MDTQLKKGLLEYCVLSAIARETTYGYQIIKDVSSVIEISESTLYPILKRLTTQKLVVTFSSEHNGRLRKYYDITTEGTLYLSDFVKDWDDVMLVYKFIEGGIV